MNTNVVQPTKFETLYVDHKNILSRQDRNVISEHLYELYNKKEYLNIRPYTEWIFYIIDGYCKSTIQELENTLKSSKYNESYFLLVNKDKLSDDILPYLSLPVSGITSLSFIKRNPHIVLESIIDKGLFIEPDFHRVVVSEMERINNKKNNIERLVLNNKKVARLLSDKEQNILQLILDGLNNKKIAEELHFAPATISTSISRILIKIEAKDRTEAMVKAIRNGWVDAER